MTIYTVGDSHACAGWGTTAQYIWLGPKLCYSFGRDVLKTFDIRTNCNIQQYPSGTQGNYGMFSSIIPITQNGKNLEVPNGGGELESAKLILMKGSGISFADSDNRWSPPRNIQNGDTIIFCFGEIDCRCHIHKYVNSTKAYQSIIDDIVEKYFDAIALNISVSPVLFKNVCVYNVVPPIHEHNTPQNEEYPCLGTDQDRKNYVLYFNKKLKEKCSQNNYIFFDIYDKYADSDGFLIKDLSDGHNHIKDGKYIQEFIDEKLQSTGLPMNELNGTPPLAACPISNLHRCKHSERKDVNLHPSKPVQSITQLQRTVPLMSMVIKIPKIQNNIKYMILR